MLGPGDCRSDASELMLPDGVQSGPFENGRIHDHVPDASPIAGARATIHGLTPFVYNRGFWYQRFGIGPECWGRSIVGAMRINAATGFNRDRSKW